MKERYRVICSKSYYCFRVFFAFALAVLFLVSFEYGVLERTDNRYVILGFALMSIYPFYLMYAYTFKSIYLTIDLKEKVIVYGNVAMNQETDFSELKIIRKKMLSSTSYLIELDSRKYHLSADKAEIDFLQIICG